MRLFDRFPAPAVMGVLNVTPDSFSDGGEFFSIEAATTHARELAGEGAAILDVGGESTRPGAQPVPLAEELLRVVPVIERVAAETGTPISIDTMKADVAEAAVRAGASLVNDVTALRGDRRMAEVVAAAGVPVCLMHMLGEPRTMQDDPRYGDVVAEVCEFLAERAEWAQAQGVDRDQICVDPGIGFGKTTEHNLALLRRLDEVVALGYPVVIGVSRKRFLGALTGCRRARPRPRLDRRGPRGRAARGVDAAGARRGRDAPGARGRGRDRGRVSGPLIEIRGLRVFAYHGVFEHERRDGQDFVLDITLLASSDAAGSTDELGDAVDYGAVCERAVELTQSGPYNLIERVAELVATSLLAEFPVDRVTVRVAKPDAPIPHPFDHVAVTVTHER